MGENGIFGTVNQRVSGSSPEGGADIKEKGLYSDSMTLLSFTISSLITNFLIQEVFYPSPSVPLFHILFVPNFSDRLEMHNLRVQFGLSRS